MDNTLQIMLAKLEREILALKTAGKASPRIQAYTKVLENAPIGTRTITYADGSQPIISEFYFENGDAVGFTPSGNTQKVVIFSQSVGDLTVVSIRPIVSIT